MVSRPAGLPLITKVPLPSNDNTGHFVYSGGYLTPLIFLTHNTEHLFAAFSCGT
jgi:hypothetical protein